MAWLDLSHLEIIVTKSSAYGGNDRDTNITQSRQSDTDQSYPPHGLTVSVAIRGFQICAKLCWIYVNFLPSGFETRLFIKTIKSSRVPAGRGLRIYLVHLLYGANEKLEAQDRGVGSRAGTLSSSTHPSRVWCL